MQINDIIIVGAGVVGLTTALALAKKTSLQITLLESSDGLSSWNKSDYDLRVSAISLASQRIFNRLNVWDAIANKRISPYKKMSVWDETSKAKLDFNCAALFTKQLGWIIEDNVMRASLFEAVANQKNLTLHKQVKLQTLERNAEAIILKSATQTWQTKLIIAADGANSWVRNAAEITFQEKNYHQKALVATIETELPHQQTAYQRFLKTGPLAFLPLQVSNQSSIVWSLDNALAENLLTLDENKFKNTLAENFSHRLGAILNISERKTLPLSLRHADTYAQENLVLIGDAAHTIHPLAGQGVNLGLLDAACLVDVITDAVKKRREYYSHATLRRYERNRKTENATMLNFVDSIKKLFEIKTELADRKILNFLKEMGVNATNNINFIKNIFTTQAVGNQSLASLTKP